MINQPQDQLTTIRVTPGMDVCDVGGDKVGSVSHVYEPDRPTDGSPATGETFFEVKTGLFGLGHHYFFPLGAVQEMVGEAVYLSKSKEQFEELGWDKKPVHLADHA